MEIRCNKCLDPLERDLDPEMLMMLREQNSKLLHHFQGKGTSAPARPLWEELTGERADQVSREAGQWWDRVVAITRLPGMPGVQIWLRKR